MSKVTITAEVEEDDMINELEYSGHYVFKSDSLVDRMILDWFDAARLKYTLEEFEEKFPV
jgi:hypothetical protein